MKHQIFTLLFVICAIQISAAQDFRFGKVSKEELQEKVHPTDPDANAAVLYREFRTEFQYAEGEGFYLVIDFFERIKIYNKEGFDWGNKKISMYLGDNGKESITGLKAYTYFLDSSGKVDDEKLRKDGIFEDEVSDFREVTKFTMPDLKEGSVIEFKYTIKSPYVGNIDEFKFQELIPVNAVSLRFASPEYFNYKTHQKGWIPYQLETYATDRTIGLSNSRSEFDKGGNLTSRAGTRDLKFKENVYKVDLTNVIALKEEPYSNNIDTYSSALKFELSYTDFPNSSINTYATTWEAVSKSIYDSENFGGQLNKSGYFKDEVDALIAGVVDEDEKMMKIFEFVKTKMVWNKYNGVTTNEGVKTAFKEGKGNAAEINLMLTAMLRYAGINANPILVSTKNYGIPLFPTREGFNYVIAGVEKHNEVVLLDATNKKVEMGILDTKLLNWQGRIIREEGSSTWVPLMPTNPAVQSTMINADILEDLSANGSSKNRFTGHLGLKYRMKYESVSEEDQRKSIEKDIGETEVSNIAFENLKTLYQPVTLSYDFETFDAVEKIGDKLYFSPLLFMVTKENPFKLEERLYPIDFIYPQKDRYLISISLPEGYKVDTMPEDTSFGLEQNALNYRYAVKNTGDKIQLSIEYSVNQAFMAAGEYESLKKFFELVIDKEKEKIVLSRI